MWAGGLFIILGDLLIFCIQRERFLIRPFYLLMPKKPSTEWNGRWIKILYNTPSAEVLTNSIISQPFIVNRGTCQGYPVSPMLFVLTIEPLAIAIRSHTHISGLKIGGTDNRIALYTDDIVLFVKNLSASLPAIKKLIESFGIFSGYKVSNSKSNILFLKQSERLNPRATQILIILLKVLNTLE